MTPHKKGLRAEILGVYMAAPVSHIGEDVYPKLGIDQNTGTGRLSELKGITVGHKAQLIRVGTKDSAKGLPCDDLIYVGFASEAQKLAHIEWVKAERSKLRQDCLARAEKYATAPVEIAKG